MPNPGDLYGRPWSEREYILALDYYFTHRGETHDKDSTYVLELSRLLGRTPASIVMRLQNFASLDGYRTPRGRGLRHIGPQGKQAFENWVHKVDALRSCAQVFLREAERAATPTLFEPEPVRVPRAFCKYELLDCVGEGSFGSVFSCVNPDDGEQYAIKIIRTGELTGSELLGRFRREMKTLRSVDHANVMRIYDDNLDENDKYPAFVMDLAEGNLFDHVQSTVPKKKSSTEKPLLPFGSAHEIMLSVILAVEALHNMKPQILHRDINPKNILRLPEGRWVLADFSLAKFVCDADRGSSFRTQTGNAFGTAPYTAPEQWRDFGSVDAKADVYSLGVLLWELFSPDWPPFERASHGLPDSLGALLLKSTERDATKRCQSVAEFRHAFEHAVASLTTSTAG